MSDGPCFHVKLDHGHVAAFKKVMKAFDVEISTCEQIGSKEFLVTFEEPTTTLFDAMDFYPVASWLEVPLRTPLSQKFSFHRCVAHVNKCAS